LGRYDVETGVEEIDRSSDESGSLSGEEIDDGIVRIGEAQIGLLDVKVGRDAPEALLTGGPETVGDIVEETAFSFDTLGKEECVERAHAGVAYRFIMASVAVTRILEEDGGRHLGPMEAEVLLSSS
jgi:hypothetical protein